MSSIQEQQYDLRMAKKKYMNLGDNILSIEIEKGTNGLGLSLAGHKDRSKMAVFICGVNPNGAAYKTGSFRVGDEILEVNGYELHGRCHLNASVIIKSMTGTIFKLIILRKHNDKVPDELAVKPITQFPVELVKEAVEETFSMFKGVHMLVMKKTTHIESHANSLNTLQASYGLGFKIVEGKHSQAGHGIFIFEIQPGSVASKSGLIVGDMILSVNNDSFIGLNYDAATQILKRVEGKIELVVCNPKRDNNSSSNENSYEYDGEIINYRYTSK